jgi:hypothetical protein
VDDPTETPKDLVAEAERGRSERTPFLAISGVALVVGLLVAVVLGIAFAVYLIA